MNLFVLKFFLCFPSLTSLLSFASDSDLSSSLTYAAMVQPGTVVAAQPQNGVQNFSLSDTACGMAASLTNT